MKSGLAVFAVVLTLLDASNALSCTLECDKSACKPLDCPGAEVQGACLCCNRCAKQEDDACGGDFGLSGVCDNGLSCTNPEPKVEPGLVTLVSQNRGGICIKNGGSSCQEVCDNTDDENNSPTGLSRRGRSVYLTPSYISNGFWVYCDCSQFKAWTVIQRRMLNYESFDKSYEKYQRGFGVSTVDFWLGLERIHGLTAKSLHEMKVVFKVQKSQRRFKTSFKEFAVGNFSTSYKLHVKGTSNPTSKGFASIHNGMAFSAPDMDNDRWWKGECAKFYRSGWWFNRCTEHNLNGFMYDTDFMPFIDDISMPPIEREDGPDRLTWDQCRKGKIEAAEIWIRPI